MEFFTVSLLNGLSYGLLLFMLSSGLTLIFSMMGVLNFAHASFYMVGAYVAYSIAKLVGFWPALLALFIYALLPIVRNVHAGLREIPPGIHDAALALDDRHVGEVEAAHIVVNGTAGEHAVPNSLNASQWLQGFPTDLLEAETTRDEMAFWMYSSGSTGRGKVMETVYPVRSA